MVTYRSAGTDPAHAKVAQPNRRFAPIPRPRLADF
jgi:hypothetical protein